MATMETGKEGRLYFPALDTLRGFFAVIVIVFHAYLQEIQVVPLVRQQRLFTVSAVGAFGVTFFFVLSSFLITHLLLEEKGKRGKVAIGAFYARRILRIWPVYFAALGIGLFVIDRVAGGGSGGVWGLPFALFYANFLMAAMGVLPSPPMTYAPLWSVSIEEQFYLVWPVVASVVKERFLWIVALVLILAAEFCREWRFDLIGHANEHFWFHTTSHLDCFAIGALAALIYRSGRAKPLQKYPLPVCLAAWLGVCLVQWNTGTIIQAPDNTLLGLRTYVLIPFLAAAAILACATAPDQTPRALTSKGMLYLGRISYGMYAYHGIWIQMLYVRNAAVMHQRQPMEQVTRLVLLLVLTFVTASLSFYLLERPILKLKTKFQRVASGTA